MERPARRSARLLPALVLSLAIVVTTACGRAATPPSPDIAPLGRLGRWDGTTFAPVAPGGIGSGNLYVLVHGWAAGFRGAVDSYQGPGPLLGWDPQAVDDDGEQFIQVWLAPMAAALSRLDPAAVVVAYSWLDQTATDRNPLAARISESRTVLNGERLAVALGQAVAPGFRDGGGRVHVLGHSHGAKVATVASLGLEPRPAQLTLFDSVDTVVPLLVGANNHLVPYLQRLGPGRAPGATFVDNYFSEFGRAYGNEPGLEDIVDTSLEPGQFRRTEVMDRHLYPPRWYTAAADQPDAGVGPMWSPLLGKDVATLGPYHVRTDPASAPLQLSLRPAPRPPPPDAVSFLAHWRLELVAAGAVVVTSFALVVVGVHRRRTRRRLARS